MEKFTKIYNTSKKILQNEILLFNIAFGFLISIGLDVGFYAVFKKDITGLILGRTLARFYYSLVGISTLYILYILIKNNISKEKLIQLFEKCFYKKE